MKSAVLLLAVVLLQGCCAFYLPGVQPHGYKQGEKVDVKVNKLTSAKNQLPYEYYKLPFCKPDEVEVAVENLGEVLRGDRIENSLYEVLTMVEEKCKLLCHRQYTEEEMKQFAQRVKEEYRVNWIADNLPAATPHVMENTKTGEQRLIYEAGFALGYVGEGMDNFEDGVPYINNHIEMKFLYHDSDDFEGYRIVGFEVAPYSLLHKVDANGKLLTCGDNKPKGPQRVDKAGTIVWTYNVEWERSDVKWASRWDTYLYMLDTQIHWFSILNSLMLVLFLSGVVALIMTRTVRRDFERYEELVDAEDLQEDTGWKLLHADVFRPPKRALWMAVLAGSGAQVFLMVFTTIVFALLGFLSPAMRGAFMTAAIVLYALFGFAAGYHSSRVYKSLKGKNWKQCTVLTATVMPGFCFAIFFILDMAVWAEGSSAAVPFGTMLLVMVLWFLLSVPLVFAGAWFGFKKEPVEPPCRTNQIARGCLEPVWYLRPVPAALIGGIMPFGAVFIELFFILSSIWQHHMYYMFGFVALVFAILVITCAEISIVMVYFHLCAEDWRWWWRSVFSSASSALYMFLYAIFYYVYRLDVVNFVSGMMYFGYTFMLCAMFAAMTGVVGLYSSMWFVRKIYSSIKVE